MPHGVHPVTVGLVQKEATGAPGREYHILVVDDEPDIRDAVKGILERGIRNSRVFTAESGLRGLDLLRGEHIDLIVTDYKMPGMNGVEFLQRAQTIAPKASRVLITAFERELAGELGPRANVEMVLTKPLEPRPLVQTCQKILSDASPQA